ncbi:phosphoethanolamine transferase [Tabrizicola oligotrophica]|uniref:Phosphoethanolamine--lipid A transferase n=1 Tax=Tabrizicola oligotrophica TaxID=2710650 RepID=A0A6M0QPY5_9RHOB|nr:phosphoethanolamine--lipid A transferase [Tabrizicola oligotrophica]NEY88804.1 phosphoethanolamine--lipid A transferase [Tabrizicola oligotrophica]
MTLPDADLAGRPRSRLARIVPAGRPALSPLTLNLLVAAFLAASANFTYYTRVADYLAGRPLLIGVAGVLAYGAILFCISVFALPGLVRPVLAVALVLGAVASHFQERLGVVIDRDMLQNALNTTGNESRHLMTADFLLHLTGFGLIPAALVLWTRAKPMRWWVRALHYPLAIGLALALFFGAMMADYRSFSSMFRERREIASAVIPVTPIVAGVRFAKQKLVTANLVAAPIGLDAHKGPRILAAGKPTLTLIVVGETSRAANWSLGSYDRPTNPELARRDIVYLDKVTSCGTSTAVSMPCMFAHYGMEQHSETAARSHQNLLDLLKQTDFDVQWFDNNTGSLGIAARLPETRFKPADEPNACALGECTDMVFLPTLDRLLAGITRDTVIVYHQIGSHGPAYYLRYPESFRPFPDDCRSGDFGACSPEQITNAYDNTIAYTDLFLATLIDRMGAQDRVAASMLYVSDHGESLGENGLYLHAAPYFMAPEVQTQVPMVLWTSPAYRRAMGLDQDCMKRKAAGLAGKASHDEVFHTLLGLADVTTSLHNADLDLTTGCHG